MFDRATIRLGIGPHSSSLFIDPELGVGQTAVIVIHRQTDYPLSLRRSHGRRDIVPAAQRLRSIATDRMLAYHSCTMLLINSRTDKLLGNSLLSFDLVKLYQVSTAP